MAKHTYYTPVGTARYCHLAKPDTKFNPEGKYTVELILDDEAFAKVKKEVDDFVATQQFKNPKRINLPYSELEDGTKIIRASSAYRPFLSDSRGKTTFDPRSHDPKNFPRIGGGSKLRLQVVLFPYTTLGGGVSFQLNGVQIVSLVEYGGSGFGAVDGDYVAPEDISASSTQSEGALAL